MQTLAQAMSRSPYPGRGIVLGLSGDGKHAVAAYFIMGRSENSRNRIFVAEGDDLRTQAFDASKVADPSLIIYRPVWTHGPSLVVTNGDQTETIREALLDGRSFESALRTRTFEPDAPNWTPRISGLMTIQPGGCRYTLSLLKSADGDPEGCLRFFYEYDTPRPGTGHFLHTYANDGDPLPSFIGEPEPVLLNGDLEDTADVLWQNLNESNKVSLFVRFTDCQNGTYQQRILNKHI